MFCLHKSLFQEKYLLTEERLYIAYTRFGSYKEKDSNDYFSPKDEGVEVEVGEADVGALAEEEEMIQEL